MKTFIFAILTVFLINAFTPRAEASDCDLIENHGEGQTYRVTQKDDNVYVLTSIYNPKLKIIVETKKGTRLEKGQKVFGLMIKKTKMIEVSDSDGFEHSVQAYKQCQ